MSMTVIEIQTTEGGRLEWVSVFKSSDLKSAIEWGDTLLAGFERNFGSDPDLRPNLRVLDDDAHRGGKVIGAWQADGYTGPDDDK